MKFVPSIELLRKAYEKGYAVPSFCAWNAETTELILRVATRMRAPVMLMSGPGEFPVMGPRLLGPVSRTVAEGFDVLAALHLDHGDSLPQVRDCLDAGYTSVMLDFSARPYAENAAALRQVSQWARPLGMTVEGEIGAVGKVDNTTVEGSKFSTLTDPDEAKRYADETGVDILAISIGNAHGLYTRLPRFDFDRLEAIRRRTNIPLVLHGGSGTPEADLKRAISLGIAKVNVASEICKAFKDALLTEWGGASKRWYTQILGDALKPVEPVLEKWIRMTGAEGKA